MKFVTKTFRWLIARVWLVIVAVIAITIVYRWQIINGFSILPGDRYDGVISTSILEHWFNFVKGSSSWHDAKYFYPYSRTIANTDAYFVVGMLYVPFRIIGFDPFMAAEFAGAILRMIGFYGIYFLLIKYFGVDKKWAALSGILFVLSNAIVSHGSRIHFFSIYIAPCALCLLLIAARGLLGHKKYQALCGMSAFVTVMGAWCMTSFYIAWFFSYWLLFVIVFVVVFSTSQQKKYFLSAAKFFGFKYWTFVFTVLLLSLAPFVYAFYPKSLEVGVRPYASALSKTVGLDGVIQVGRDNYLFGKLYNEILKFFMNEIDVALQGEYYNTGISFFLFLLFILSGFYIFKKQEDSYRILIVRSTYVGTVVSWALTLNFFGRSAWFFLYSLIPGAKALNVVSVYQMFVYFPVLFLTMILISQLKLSRAVFVFFAIALVLGELTGQYLNLDRKLELARLDVPAPSIRCDSFFTTGWADQKEEDYYVHNLYKHNVPAIYIAQMHGVPAINGYASFLPSDWNFSNPNRHDYIQRIEEYVLKHQLSNVCKLDLNTKSWERFGVDFSQFAP